MAVFTSNSFGEPCIAPGDKAAYLMQSAAEKAHSVKEAGEDKKKASPKKAAPKKAAPKKAEAEKKKAAPKKVGFASLTSLRSIFSHSASPALSLLCAAFHDPYAMRTSPQRMCSAATLEHQRETWMIAIWWLVVLQKRRVCSYACAEYGAPRAGF